MLRDLNIAKCNNRKDKECHTQLLDAVDNPVEFELSFNLGFHVFWFL